MILSITISPGRSKAQFELLHSKYHLCTPTTRQLLLSTYVKFINLFPELKETIVEVLSQDSNYRSSNVEIQQRSVEYLALSKVVTEDILVSLLTRDITCHLERTKVIIILFTLNLGSCSGGDAALP